MAKILITLILISFSDFIFAQDLPSRWYADFPNHYAGEGDKGTAELGKLITENTISSLITSLKAVKADTKTLQLQNEYFNRVDKLKKINE